MTSALSPRERAAAVRRGAGLFPLDDRGLIEVSGDDRTRWLDGMVSNDVDSLTPGRVASGCYALFLSPKGRILADLHVLLRPESFWLEVASDAADKLATQLDRYIIADDVVLTQRGADIARFGIEGPAAFEIVGRAASGFETLAPGSTVVVEIAGVPVTLAAFGWTGELALQLFVPRPQRDVVLEALRGAEPELVPGDAETLELMRIEAGVPKLGVDIDEEVLPAEAHLDWAISTTKGCYIGQEIVARLRSRGQVNHLLVGLRVEGVEAGELPELFCDDRRIGELTSRAVSETAGSIALGYVRREHAEPGTRLRAGAGTAEVASLPFVAGSNTETSG